MSLWDEYSEIQDRYPGWELKDGTDDTLVKEDGSTSLTIVKKRDSLYEWERVRPFAIRGVVSRMSDGTDSLEDALRYVGSPDADVI
jgi:hypothetical protein